MRRIFAIVAAVLALLPAACGKPDKKGGAAAPSLAEPVPMGELSRVVVPLRYRLSLTIDPAKTQFSGHAEIDVRFAIPRRTLFLHGLGLNVSGAEVRLGSGRTIPAHYDQVDRSGVARLVFVDKVPTGRATLVFDYDAPFGRTLGGLYKVADRGASYVFTQFEATDARRAFPAFDQPGFKTPFNITITAPARDRVIANTPVFSATRLKGGMRRTVFRTTKPLPTYLVAFAVGPFDLVDAGSIPPDAQRSRPVPLRGIAAKGEGARLAYALSLTPRIVTAIEDYTGVGYPYPKLDLIAVPDFAAGAMENAGAITFRERYLLMGADAPLSQKRASLLVQAHEISHQWFGDLVTPDWWDNIWLNESFATWMQAKIAQAVLPGQDFATETLRAGFDVMDTDDLPAARAIHQPVKSADDIASSFDGITYDKGAAVLAMFERYTGAEAWRAGIHAYLTKYAFGTATAQDFIATMARVTGHPEIVQAFRDYIGQAGVPLLHTSLQCHLGARVAVLQTAYSPPGIRLPPRSWHVPACFETATGLSMCRIVDTAARLAELGNRCPAWVMPNAGEGYYLFDPGRAGWTALLAAARRMDAADRITLIENLDAAVRAGAAAPADLLALIRALAPDASWDVLTTMRGVLHDLRLGALSDAGLAAYRAFVQKTFGPRLHTLRLAAKPQEAPGAALARQELAMLLVTEAQDPMTTAELSAAAHAYVASGGKTMRRLAPDLLPEALRAGLRADPAFAGALAHLLVASDDEDVRRAVVYAFAGATDRGALETLFAAVPRMRTGELRYLYFYLGEEPKARAVLWPWFKAHYPALVARASRQGMASAVDIFGTACDAGAKRALDGFFKPKISYLEGIARPLALTGEAIDRCIAFRRQYGAAVAAAFRSQRP